MGKSSKRSFGDRDAVNRDFVCSRCGHTHRNRSKEQRECRAMHRRGEVWKPAPGPAPKGTPVARHEATRYQNDPLGGNKRDHLILRKARENWPLRKIAKFMDMPVSDVRAVIQKAGRT